MTTALHIALAFGVYFALVFIAATTWVVRGTRLANEES